MLQPKANILLVDDLPENLHAMKMALAPLEDVEIITAQSGNEALSLMLDHEFAVVLLDVQMPEMDGFETAALMQDHPATRDTPIIFVTAINKEDAHVFKGYATGAVDYLFKPVHPDILLSKVSVFLNLYRQRIRCEDMQKELQKVRNLEALGVLAGGIAHDFNNLMTTVFANIELAQMRCDRGGRVYQKLAETLKGIEEAQRLTQELLIFSKGDRPTKDVFDIVDVLEDAVTSQLDGTSIAFHLEVKTETHTVEADRDQISRALQNIAQNARESMPEGGNVSVKVENTESGHTMLQDVLKDGCYIKITLEDDGPGMPEEVLARIFDPYFSTKEKGRNKGQGLGLAITHSIIRKHGGYIQAASHPGRGTSFSIYLPESRKKEEVVRQTEKESPPAALASGRKRLLVLESEESVGGILVEMLKHLKFEAQLAGRGDQALALYAEAQETVPFAGVILGLSIGDNESGIDILKQLRKLDPQVKAVACSGFAGDPTISNCKEYGFNGAIKKPFTLKSIAETVNQVF